MELTSSAERGWWLRTRRPDDAVSTVFRVEGEPEADCPDSGALNRGPFNGLVVGHEGRMTVVQVFLDGVVGGYIVDLDTADGESRVVSRLPLEVARAIGSSVAGYFAVATSQVATDED